MNSLLETQHLTIQIGKKIICDDLNLQIHAGECWGILGPNGCGKTTLLHTLANLKQPSEGSVYLSGKNIKTLSPKKIARQLGILLQETQLVFPQTVFEYCLTGRHPHLSVFSWENNEDRQLTTSALALMELTDLSQHNIFTLSGGERRRLAIATLLTQSPLIHLLDEPTNHLDLRHQVKALNHFKQLSSHSSAAVLMSLHDVNLAQVYCNKILLLFGDGEILSGTPQDVLTTENLSRLFRHPLQTGSVWVPVY